MQLIVDSRANVYSRSIDSGCHQ